MGERQSDGGLPGRRRVHPGGPVSGARRTTGPYGTGSGSRRTIDTADLEALLVASLIRDGVDAEAELRAVAAFRAARDAGAPQEARTRRRDDWRPRERWAGRSLKTMLSVLAASLTLGGVAVAAIGAAGSATDDTGDDGKRPHPATSAPGRSAGTPSDDGTASPPPGRPAPAQDTEAHCRAYEQVGSRGKALDATAWQRLVAAAGGEKNVAAYCSEQLARAVDGAKPGKPDGPDSRPGNSDDAGDAARNGSGGTQNGSGRTDSDAGGDSGADGTGNSGSGADGAGSGADTGSGTGAGSGADNGQGKPAQPNGKNQ
ncbi:hypothetical protein GCM10027074_29790 [Streptomyces deserti]